MTRQSFAQQSYESHAAHFEQFGIAGEKGDLAATWREDHSVDSWRHTRMYQTIDPVLTADPQATWLTVGDGRFGRDARYILQKGVDALPTDIAETLLAQAVQSGYIQRYQIENAEALSFESNTFDYVFCKESYHHFPRPMIAFKGINDEYVEGCEFEPLQDKGPKYQQISKKIRRRDRWCRLHLLDELLLTAMIFKVIPDETVVRALTSDGYEVVFLPQNPYLAHDPS